MIFKNSYLIVVLITLVTGCSSTPRIPTVDENEAFKYERKYLAENEQLKNSFSDQTAVKWVQPANKKIPCKVYVAISKTEDRTLDENYKIYWDGDCKNGYANGLGREIEKGTVLNMEALAIYQGKEQEPQYYIQTYHLDNKIQEGDINNGYYVETTINEDNFNFDIGYKYGYFGTYEKPALVTYSSPLSDTVSYTKNYINFYYQLFDNSTAEFEKSKYTFYMINRSQQKIGFAFEVPKIGSTYSAEFSNGNILRLVRLPESYYNNVNSTFSEVKQAGQQAINSQKQALKVKKQYMNKICKKSVAVNFIDNEEYKSICKDREHYTRLKEKIKEKLAEINQEKQQKREQLNQQKIINARVSQATAAQRQANAAEQAHHMQSWQNLNNNLQMQQLNNNLMFMRMGY